jgi:cob(I)alamin adenosyltransferase
VKIYTKKGDSGTTQLIGGTRVAKHHIRIDSYGTVDELNSHIGLIADWTNNTNTITLIREIQDRLFTLGSLLAADPTKSTMKLPQVTTADVELLETEIDKMTEQLPVMTSFILPGGTPLASQCHIARCVCRRAERAVTHLNEMEEVDGTILTYLNRLSDYLFTLSRFVLLEAGVVEIKWVARL